MMIPHGKAHHPSPSDTAVSRTLVLTLQRLHESAGRFLHDVITTAEMTMACVNVNWPRAAAVGARPLEYGPDPFIHDLRWDLVRDGQENPALISRSFCPCAVNL